jgi:pentatricopeptide repeat protein
VCYNVLIRSLGEAGRARDAVQVFEEMKRVAEDNPYNLVSSKHKRPHRSAARSTPT